MLSDSAISRPGAPLNPLSESARDAAQNEPSGSFLDQRLEAVLRPAPFKLRASEAVSAWRIAA
eukprot:14812434-Alexandrium_andersonii.AAC.1